MFRFSQSKHPNFLKIHQSAENIFNEIPLVKRRRRLRRIFKTLKYFSFGILLLFLVFFLSLGAQIFNLGNVYKKALSGKANLEHALYLATEENFGDSIVFAANAENDFSFSLAAVKDIESNFFVSHISFLQKQFKDAEYLFDTALVLSRGLKRSMIFGNELQELMRGDEEISFSKLSKKEKELVLSRIYESGPELELVKADLDQAHANLENISGLILIPFGKKITELEEKIEAGQTILDKAIPMAKILPYFAGYPKKTSYLVVLHNSDELRPTGGFIGTYGIVETESGDILRSDTHDIYHMDMPVKDLVNVTPPLPIQKYLVPKWYMRDANWSPDWPTAAEKILWFYELEDKLLPAKNQINNFSGQFDGVLGLTPEFITDLLKITGPIVIEGQEYNSENFTQLLEYRVEKGYVQLGVPSWERKEVIGEIVKELKVRLLDLPSLRWKEIVNAMDRSILQKNILIYSKNKEVQNLVSEKNWSGEIVKTDKDYLLVVDANMGALKTDAVMKRSMDYSLEQRPDGMYAKLQINYAHLGGRDWRTSEYKTYTRVYVPTGSKLITHKGARGDVTIESESGKTSFGVYFVVDPGKIGSLYFEYKLPDKLNYSPYELYVQKQPGAEMDELSIDLRLANTVKSYSPAGFFVTRADNRIKWETDLKMDRIFRAE